LSRVEGIEMNKSCFNLAL